MDLSCLVLITSVALPLTWLSSEARWAFAALAACVVVVAVIVVLARAWERDFASPRLAILASGKEALRSITPVRLAAAAPVVLISWCLEAAVLYSVAYSLGLDVSLRLAIGATAFTILFQVIHLTPGGVGIYEASMTGVLSLAGLPMEQALLLAVMTHAVKFAYSYAVGLPFFLVEAVALLRGRADRPKSASSLEIVVARMWNAVNEGKPFTIIFSLAMLLLLALPDLLSIENWLYLAVSIAFITPLYFLFARFDFPLQLRLGLWVYLAAFFILFRFIDPLATALVLASYLVFTVFVWGTLYYHLRIGTRWTNFLRFWRLVLENPDPTSGNFQEQVPKVLLLVLITRYLMQNMTPATVAGIEAFVLGIGVTAVLLHQWFFNWVPALPMPIERARLDTPRTSKRFIVIAIDGCRADRLREANTPFIDKLRNEGTEFTNVATVYPARTVTCFSSMLTGAPPAVHAMRSNFVPDLGIKCESIFDVLRRASMTGRLVGIAHLIDAFGEEYVRSVTAVMHNDEIDDALVARAKAVLETEDPEMLVLQLLSVDQTGHARGSYRDEYLAKIEDTDRKIKEFVGWCQAKGFLDHATVLITADHGQGIGIGGHGHMSPTEIHVPCMLWGEGVERGQSVGELRFVTDIADTIAHYLGLPSPAQSVGQALLVPEAKERPLVYVVPAFNEAESLPLVLTSIRRTAAGPSQIVVVDDGSSDGTASVAAGLGAVVVTHKTNLGLGAALRTGLLEARKLDARAAVYLDADGEYAASEAQNLLAPIASGEADYVLGSRFKGSIQGMPLVRKLGNHFFSALLSLACGRWISDGQTGFRAFSRRALDVAEIVHDYNYAQVLTMDLLRKGMRLKEVPVGYRRRTRGKSFISLRYLWRVPLGMAREMLSG
jgi:hypothetical protein